MPLNSFTPQQTQDPLLQRIQEDLRRTLDPIVKILNALNPTIPPSTTGIPAGTIQLLGLPAPGANGGIATLDGSGGVPLVQLGNVPWASPPAIGATAPNTGKFTTLEATGALTLDTAVAVPANGQIGKGDAAWIVPGVGGGPAWNPNGHWSNYTVPGSTTQFRKLPSGIVIGQISVTTTTANDTTPAWTMPVGYRPNVSDWYFCIQYLLGIGGYFTIDAAGNVVANPANSATKDFIGAFAYFADA